ncbi:unnamed protein product [Symbiodinium microadriaticum]|nr:unnamed protein product [Symbiodinium microadriaticum]
MWMLASFGLRSRPVPAPAMLGGSMPKGASKQKHSTKASCRTWLLACVTFAILGVQQIKMFVTLPQTSRQSEPMDSRRRALILGGMSFAAFEDQAHAASSAAAKIKECQAEASKIVGGLESTAKNALAMTPGQPGLLNSKLAAHPNWAALSRARRPRFVLLPVSKSGCGCSMNLGCLALEADSLAASPPAGLTRYAATLGTPALAGCSKADRGGPFISLSVAAVVVALSRKYMDASGSLLVGIP